MSANQYLRMSQSKQYEFSNGVRIFYNDSDLDSVTINIDYRPRVAANTKLLQGAQMAAWMANVSLAQGLMSTERVAHFSAVRFPDRLEAMGKILEFFSGQPEFPAEEVEAAAKALGVQLPQTAVTVSSFASQNSQWLADHRDELTGLGLMDKHIDALGAAQSAADIEGLQYDMSEARGDYVKDTPLGTLQGNNPLFTQYIKEAKSWERC